MPNYVYLSVCDRSEESFEAYLSTMPWTAVPYSRTTQRQELAVQFDVHGIPTLVLIDTDGSLITDDGRGEVNEDPDGEVILIPLPVILLTMPLLTKHFKSKLTITNVVSK